MVKLTQHAGFTAAELSGRSFESCCINFPKGGKFGIQSQDAIITMPVCDNEHGLFVTPCTEIANILETRMKKKLLIEQEEKGALEPLVIN